MHRNLLLLLLLLPLRLRLRLRLLLLLPASLLSLARNELSLGDGHIAAARPDLRLLLAIPPPAKHPVASR